MGSAGYGQGAGYGPSRTVVDATKVAAAGAGMLGTVQQWTATQYPQVTTVTSSSGHVEIDAENPAYYHNITEDSQIDNPDNLVAGMRWSLLVEANGTHELTWGSYYNWGNDTGAAPDCSAESDGNLCLIEFYAHSATVILAAASEWYTP